MSASLKRSQADRKDMRAQVVPVELRGLLTRVTDADRQEESGNQLPFLIWDVSAGGIGLLVSGSVSSGETVKITIGQPYLLQLTAEIMWCEPNGDQGYRCGVRVTDNEQKLTAVYEAFLAQSAE